MTDLNSESFSDRQNSNNGQAGQPKRVQKKRPIVYNEMDRAIRTFMALRRDSTDKMNPLVALFPERAESDSADGAPADPLFDLVYVHILSSAIFGNDDHVNGHETLKKIVTHPALEPLEEGARFAAAHYLFPAHLAQRRRTVGGYWVLPEIGAAHPSPVGIKTGSFPTWKRKAGKLEKMAEDLDNFFGEVMELQAATMVSAHPESMPAALLADAIDKLAKALDLMEDFPDALRLKSKYREQMRPALDTERIEIVAYALNRLYREHVKGLPFKAKEIECRIAELETAFLGQNIQSDSEVGCPAVRSQIRTVKQSEFRKVIDSGLIENVKTMKSKLRRATCDKNKLLARLWNRLERHWEYSKVWQQRTESAIQETLRGRLQATEYEDEEEEVKAEHVHQRKSNNKLIRCWLSEYEEHLNAFGTPIADVYAFSKQLRNWLRGWEAVWALQM